MEININGHPDSGETKTSVFERQTEEVDKSLEDLKMTVDAHSIAIKPILKPAQSVCEDESEKRIEGPSKKSALEEYFIVINYKIKVIRNQIADLTERCCMF